MSTDLNLDLASFIGTFDTSLDLCDRLVQEFESKSHIAHYSDDMRQYHRLTNIQISRELDEEYTQELLRCFSMYTEKYTYALAASFPWCISKPYNLQKYYPGKHYSAWHCETSGPEKGKYLRTFTFLTYLNDVTDGGETEFLYQGIKVRPKKGLTLIWPAGWTHIHKGAPSNSQVKYITTGWAIFSDKI